ncbi:transcription termination/antitermination NusG family protein [Polynucleobacter kasalickyi]|uniref:Transcriptional antiterminator RfaH n=1 Tax=Polynucleobacter kasalickyi TaxID=1938817 RepID=A0A1W2CCB1_9BURK|nr:transcription termination/antitermination NusG family protein [Polynucleobacter kasalickyi]SMC82308.1 transcriptional antiterminator RfaH [Polynucleobacter kasalickyi]
MNWYVIHTKPRQEFRAQENLQNQGFEVYLPTISKEVIRSKSLEAKPEPLFARYLFIQLDQLHSNWFPIRSTRGVHQMLRFGMNTDPVKVPNELLELIKEQAKSFGQTTQKIFESNEQVMIQEGPMKGLSGSFQEIQQQANGEMRAMVLIDLLGKLQKIQVPVATLSKLH